MLRHIRTVLVFTLALSFTSSALGAPNNALIPQWTPYTAADRQTMDINSKAWACRKDLNADNLAALRGVYEDNLLD